MVYLSEESQSRQEEDLASPDNPTEHKVCMFTLICSLVFVAAGAYFLIAPSDGGFKSTVMMIAGGAFILAMASFFTALFTGKLCGCKKSKSA